LRLRSSRFDFRGGGGCSGATRPFAGALQAIWYTVKNALIAVLFALGCVCVALSWGLALYAKHVSKADYVGPPAQPAVRHAPTKCRVVESGRNPDGTPWIRVECENTR
jgi:hypothetical protein